MDEWTDRLSGYVDGGLTPADAAALEGHLADCEACRSVVTELEAVIRAARTLPDRPPTHDLWDGILARIRHDNRVVPFPQRMRRSVSATIPQLAAAAVAIMMVSGGAVWLALRGSSSQPADIARTGETGASDVATQVQPVAAVEANYDLAIRELEIMLAAMRERMDPSTIGVIERNLAIIDAAIADARRAIASNPDDLFLYRHLDGTLMKKVDLLRRATNAGRVQT